ncbi:MAG: acetoin utilization protein AcuC [Gammaproteobacteria bacterium]|nr:acetoin utilization protein AcuC [Gammaproteobacteria bacterium]
MTKGNKEVLVLKGENIAAYGFGRDHPFGPDRHDAFHAELQRSGVADLVDLRAAGSATREELLTFHSAEFIDTVTSRCEIGEGFLDGGDTPAQQGIAEAASAVVGAAIHAMESIMAGRVRRAFVPIAGLHHAGRKHVAGFCVFNDCGVVIELLRARHGLRRVAYVDIDAHHGDGVFYAFENDPDLCCIDIHEDGHYLYPGTGHAFETGSGIAAGTKLNIPLRPGAGDAEFRGAWPLVESFLESAEPEFILLQCGADSLDGDPITHLKYSPDSHAYAAGRLCAIADKFCAGRLLAVGGGGYNRSNLAKAWTAVVGALVRHS